MFYALTVEWWQMQAQPLAEVAETKTPMLQKTGQARRPALRDTAIMCPLRRFPPIVV